MAGGGELEIGTISYDKPGTYVYTVHEKAGGIQGWQYDPAIYTITILVKEKDNVLTAQRTIVKDDIKTDNVVFTNTFGSSDKDMTIVSGVKSWEHGNDPKSKRSDAIIVKVYGDGELAAQRQITEDGKWCYAFILPRFDDDGANDDPMDKDGLSNQNSVKTGDVTKPIMWIVLMIISLLGAVLIIRRR